MKQVITARFSTAAVSAIALAISSTSAYAHPGHTHLEDGHIHFSATQGLLLLAIGLGIAAAFYCVHKAKSYRIKTAGAQNDAA